MTTSFFFADDSYNEKHRIAALTGVIVPIDSYVDIRRALVGRLIDRFGLPEDHLMAHMPELRASRLLPEDDPFIPDWVEVDDDLRFGVTRDVVDVIVQHKLRVYRCGYYVPHEPLFGSALGNRHAMYSLCWSSLMRWLNDVELAHAFVIPVMDFGDLKLMRSIVGSTTSGHTIMDILEHTGRPIEGLVRDSDASTNLVGEVLFADSAYAPFVQFADMAGYLLSIEDHVRYGEQVGSYKAQLHEIGQILRQRLVAEAITVMEFDGEPIGPTEYEHRYFPSIPADEW